MQELIKIQSELKAPKGQFNKHGKYKYRSCEDILEAVKPLLLKYDCLLLLSDDIVYYPSHSHIVIDAKNTESIEKRDVETDGHFYVKAKAIIVNSAGVSLSVEAFAREPETRKGMDYAQVTGATSSYARKYALNGLFCIDDTKEADFTNTHGKEEVRNTKSELKPDTEQWTKAQQWLSKESDKDKAMQIIQSKYYISDENLKILVP